MPRSEVLRRSLIRPSPCCPATARSAQRGCWRSEQEPAVDEAFACGRCLGPDVTRRSQETWAWSVKPLSCLRSRFVWPIRNDPLDPWRRGSTASFKVQKGRFIRVQQGPGHRITGDGCTPPPPPWAVMPEADPVEVRARPAA